MLITINFEQISSHRIEIVIGVGALNYWFQIGFEWACYLKGGNQFAQHLESKPQRHLDFRSNFLVKTFNLNCCRSLTFISTKVSTNWTIKMWCDTFDFVEMSISNSDVMIIFIRMSGQFFINFYIKWQNSIRVKCNLKFIQPHFVCVCYSFTFNTFMNLGEHKIPTFPFHFSQSIKSVTLELFLIQMMSMFWNSIAWHLILSRQTNQTSALNAMYSICSTFSCLPMKMYQFKMWFFLPQKNAIKNKESDNKINSDVQPKNFVICHPFLKWRSINDQQDWQNNLQCIQL